MAWTEVKDSPQFAELDSFQQEIVRKREKDSLKVAQTFVKNAFELVLYLHSDGSIQARKITMGAQSLFGTLLLEKELRLFKEKIDAESIMPGGPYRVWPAADSSIRINDLYAAFGREPQLPKLLSRQTVLNSIEDAVRRGVLAVRCERSDGSEQWYWRTGIDMAEWDKVGEAWLPAASTLNTLAPSAVLPDSLKGLWPEDDSGVTLAMLCSWFDGSHSFEDVTHPDYPPEQRPIPKVDYKIVYQTVGRAVSEGFLWLVLGNDSISGEKPAEYQLDPAAVLYRPPAPLAAIDFLPTALPDAWTAETEPETKVSTLYAQVKATRGKPWPRKLFLEGLNAAIAQGFMSRNSGSGLIGSLEHDGDVGLVIRSSSPPPQPPPPPAPSGGGRASTNTVSLDIAQVQTLGEEIGELTKFLAGCDPQIEVRLTIKSRADVDLGEASTILEKIKEGWKF